MFELPTNYEPTREELLTEIRELHFELSVMQERLINAFEMITEILESIVDITDYVSEPVEHIYEQSTRQAKLHESARKRRKQ